MDHRMDQDLIILKQKLEEFSSSQPVLRSERVKLRPFLLEDAPAIFDYGRRAEIARYTTFSAHQSIDDAYYFLREIVVPSYQRGDIGPLAMEFGDAVIGAVELRHVNLVHSDHIREVGCVLHSHYWGRGLMHEVLEVLLDYAFSKEGIHKVIGRYIASHRSAQKINEYLGFCRDGVERDARFFEGSYVDIAQDSLLKHEWLNHQKISQDLALSA